MAPAATGMHRVLALIAWVTLAAGFVIQTASNAVDFDTWHQITLARDLAAGRGFAQNDPYTFTETVHPIVHHEWGTGVVIYALINTFGPGALLGLKYLLLACVAVLGLAASAARNGPLVNWGLIAVPAIPLISIGFTHAFRAQIFTYLFLVILFALLRIDEMGRRWWIPFWLVSFPVWANLHGGCAVGIVLVCVAAAERMIARKPFFHLLLVAAGMLGLLALNQYGLSYYGYLWRALRMPRPHITEWLPMWTSGSTLAVFAVCLITAYIGISETGWRGKSGLGILLATGVAALGSLKMAPVFGVAWLCYGASVLAGTKLRKDMEVQNRTAPHRPVLCWLAILAIFLAFSGSREWKLRVPGVFVSSINFPPYPAGAIQYLQAQKFTGNVLGPFEFGAYVTWKMAPQVKIFVDSRYEEVYPEQRIDEVFEFYSGGPGWKRILTFYPIDSVLIPKVTPVAAVFPESGWNQAYDDPQYRVYTRPGLHLTAQQAGSAPDGTFP